MMGNVVSRKKCVPTFPHSFNKVAHKCEILLSHVDFYFGCWRWRRYRGGGVSVGCGAGILRIREGWFCPWAYRDGQSFSKSQTCTGHLEDPVDRISENFIESTGIVQSCLTLWDRMDCSLPGFSVQEVSRQEYWSGLLFPSLGIFLTQGSNLALLYYR